MRVAFAIFLGFLMLAPPALAGTLADSTDPAPLTAAQWQEDLDALVRFVDAVKDSAS